MDFLKSDLNHNTRKYNFVKNGGGGEKLMDSQPLPQSSFHRQFFLIH